MEDQNQAAPEMPPTPAPTQPPTQAPNYQAPPNYAPAGRSPVHKTPFLAGFLSFMPGLGNIYNGLYMRGITFFFLWGGIFALTIRTGNRSDGESEALALLIPGLVFVWLFNVFDAYRQATLINHGYRNDLGLRETGHADQAPGGLMLGVAVLLIGLYGLLDHLFDLDISLLLEYWHIAFIAFGVWLIVQARRKDGPNALDADDGEI